MRVTEPSTLGIKLLPIDYALSLYDWILVILDNSKYWHASRECNINILIMQHSKTEACMYISKIIDQICVIYELNELHI